jgi:hypothetical protein
MSTPLLDLSVITLLCVETRDPALAHFAIQKCTQHARFGKIVLITDLAKLSNQPDDQANNQAKDYVKNQQVDQRIEQRVAQHVDQTVARLQSVEYVQAPPIKTTKDYSDLLLKGLRQYVKGTHL